MSKSKIEWTEESWNPITGCTPVSEGCKNCYAQRMAKRLAGRAGYHKDDPFAPGTWHGDKLDKPLKRKKPTTYFVCSMGDLFHKDVCRFDKEQVFDTMMKAYWHTFIVLTKRAEAMRNFVYEYTNNIKGPLLPHIWLGVSVESQERADERIPWLLRTPAAVRLASYEPALGPVDFSPWIPMYDYRPTHDYYRGIHGGNGEPVFLLPCLDWIIAGGESGPGARPAHPDWFRSVRDQCQDAVVAFFFKQWGEWKTYENTPPKWLVERVGKKVAGRILDGREWNEMPITHRHAM